MATKKTKPNRTPAIRLETDPPDLDPFIDDVPDGLWCRGCVFLSDLQCPTDPAGSVYLCSADRPGRKEGVIWRKKPVYGNEEE